MQEPGAQGNGNYEKNDAAIILTLTSDKIYQRLYDFGGEFDLTIDDSTLILEQVLSPELWPTSYEISLKKGEGITLH